MSGDGTGWSGTAWDTDTTHRDAWIADCQQRRKLQILHHTKFWASSIFIVKTSCLISKFKCIMLNFKCDEYFEVLVTLENHWRHRTLDRMFKRGLVGVRKQFLIYDKEDTLDSLIEHWHQYGINMEQSESNLKKKSPIETIFTSWRFVYSVDGN